MMSGSNMAEFENDSPIETSYNRVELPSSIEIKESSICKGKPGAFCKALIKKDTRFGPYKGEIIKPNDKADLNHRYAWEVLEKKSKVLKFIISSLDTKRSNWMRNVNSARFYEEQNILSVQEGFSIYYVAMKDIKPGEELLTWFDAELMLRSERRQSRKGRRPIGYTIELVPWSDEKKFVPEIIETKRARKKKVMSDMVSPDEDVVMAQRSLNRVLKASKKKEVSSQMNVDKTFHSSQVRSNGSCSPFSNGFSGNRPHNQDRPGRLASTFGIASGTPVSATSQVNLAYQEPSRVSSHKIEANLDTINKNIQQSLKMDASPNLAMPPPSFRQRSRRTGDGRGRRRNNNSALALKDEEKYVGFIKPFDPSQLRPIVFRRRDDGSTEVEDHDEIYITRKEFKNHCDHLCQCVNKADLLSCSLDSGSVTVSNCDGKEPKKSRDNLCIHFSIVPDDQHLIVCNKIIFRCDICDNAYNHAFSLKRHYLKIHINHRYLSKHDILDCQIDTFHSGIDTEESDPPTKIKDEPSSDSACDASCGIVERPNVPSLIELAREKIGLPGFGYNVDAKSLNEKDARTEEEECGMVIPKILNVMSLSTGNAEKDLLQLGDVSQNEESDFSFSAGNDKQKEANDIASHEGCQHIDKTEVSAEKSLSDENPNGLNFLIEEREQDFEEKKVSEEMETIEKRDKSQEKGTSDESQMLQLSPMKIPAEWQALKESLTPNEINTQDAVASEEKPCDDTHQKYETSLSGHQNVKPIEEDSENSEGKSPNAEHVTSLLDKSDPVGVEPMDESCDAGFDIKACSESCEKSEPKTDTQEQDMDWSPVISPDKEYVQSCHTAEVESSKCDKKTDGESGVKACDEDRHTTAVEQSTSQSDLDELDHAGFHSEPVQQNSIHDKSELRDEHKIPLSNQTEPASASNEHSTPEQVHSNSNMSVREELSTESTELVSVPPPLSSTRQIESTDAAKTLSTQQQQVILLVPVLSPTAPKPLPASKDSSTPASGPLSMTPLSPVAGLGGVSPSGAINLLSQSGMPMMVFPTVPSSSMPLSLPPSVFLQSQTSTQSFVPIRKAPGPECATLLPSRSDDGHALFVSNSNVPTSAAIVMSQHNISTLNTNLASLSSTSPIKAKSPQRPGQPNMFMSASYTTGGNENLKPSDLYRCHMCVLVFKTTSELKHHIKNDPHRFKGGVKQYACEHCSVRFRNKHNLNRHHMMHHHNKPDDKDRKFRCLTCGKGFATENHLKMHARFHLGKSFPCKYGCQDTAFPNAASLVKHLRAVHPGLNLKEYIREKAMRERLKRHHIDVSDATANSSYSIYHPGVGFQAKRGRPKGSKNIKNLKLSPPQQQQIMPYQSDRVDRPRELPISTPVTTTGEIKLETATFDLPKHRFMFKCKLCSRSFAFHLRLLQHRTKVHGFSQSVQEFLHEMSKDTTDHSDSDHDSMILDFSPPPSPKTFFPNINFRGAENMQKYIEGGLHSIQMYKEEHLFDGLGWNGDIKPAVKLEWTHYNFPLCFEYCDDTTAFYDSANGSHLLPKTEPLNPSTGHESSAVEDENESSNLPYDICHKVVSDVISAAVPEKNSESFELKYVSMDNCSEAVSSGVGSKIDRRETSTSVCADTDETRLTSFAGSLDLNCKPASERSGKESKMDCETTNTSLPQVSRVEDQYSRLVPKESDSAYSSLSSCVSGVSETETLNDQMLLNKMLLELEKHSMSSAKSEASNGKSKSVISEKQGTEDKHPFLKEEASSQVSFSQKALGLLCDKRLELRRDAVKEKGDTLKIGSIQLIKALDLPGKSIIEAIGRFNQTDYLSQWKKRRSFSSSSNCQRLHDPQTVDSVLNISDSSKHDHRRYSIWSRQHTHKVHTKDDELIHCPVVECVRKALTMREKTFWKGKKGNPASTNKRKSSQKQKEAFAEELGLMTKQDYEQSYHVKQQEIPSIKPPEIWKTYDKIWFGKKGAITVVCSICHRHFSCLELCLRHQLKKHPHIEPSSLALEKGNYVEDMYYYYPMAYGILAHTQLIPDNMPTPEVYVCTRCTFPFKNLNRLHYHLTICDPSQGEATARSKSYKRKKLLPMMDRRASQNSTPVLKTVGGARLASYHQYERPMQSSLGSKSQKPDEKMVKKGYVLASAAAKIDLKQELKVPARPAATLFSSGSSHYHPGSFTFSSGHQRRHKFGLLYNPSNHTRRRELYQVLEQHQCHGCNLKFKSMSMLERHVKKCSGKDKLRSQKPLLSALADDAALRKQHTCRYCNKRFTYIKGVDLHYKRVCSVRKVKEEEDKLTEEDLAHEAELQKIIEHMKWSKSLNKDSSDIILGHVRVEEDGTLIRVNKKRGRPHGRTKRIKKKGFKWTALKRHRPDEANLEDNSQDCISDNINSASRNRTDDTPTSVDSDPRATKGRSTSTSQTRITRDVARKRRFSQPTVESETQQQPPRKKGRPRKIRPVETVPDVPHVPGKRGRPRKTPIQPISTEASRRSLTAASPQRASDSRTSGARSRGNPIRKRESIRRGQSDNDAQDAVKPPARKRGRPKKFDPSEMESSYKKKKTTNYAAVSTTNKSSKLDLSKMEEGDDSKENSIKMSKKEENDSKVNSSRVSKKEDGSLKLNSSKMSRTQEEKSKGVSMKASEKGDDDSKGKTMKKMSSDEDGDSELNSSKAPRKMEDDSTKGNSMKVLKEEDGDSNVKSLRTEDDNSKANSSKMAKKENEDENHCHESENSASKDGGPDAVSYENLGKTIKDIVSDKEAKSISVFETGNLHEVKSKTVPANGAKSAQSGPGPVKVVKITKVQVKTNNREPQGPENKKPESLQQREEIRKTSETQKSKDEQSKIKNLDVMSGSEELFKHLIGVTESKIISEAKPILNDGNSDQTTNKHDGKSVKEMMAVSKTSTLIHKVVSPQSKQVKFIPLISSSQAPALKSFSSTVGSPSNSKQQEQQAALSNLQPQQFISGVSVSKSQVLVSNANSNVLIMAKSPPRNMALSSPPPSTKGQVMHTPVALRVISVPAGASQLVSSPSTIKLIKSSPFAASTSLKPAGEMLGTVSLSSSTPVTSSMTPPQLLSPVRANAKTIVASSPLGVKPIAVIQGSGVLRNISSSSTLPVATGSNIQLPCPVKASVSTSSTIKLPQVIAGGIRLPRVVGTQLGSAVIVQPATVLQGKPRVAAASTNIRSPPSRFTSNTLPLPVIRATGGLPTAAKIMKIHHAVSTSSPVEVKQGVEISQKTVQLGGTGGSTVTGQIVQVALPPNQGEVNGQVQLNQVQKNIGSDTGSE